MANSTLRELYRPTHDEASRHRFVGALKNFANGELETQLAVHYESALRSQRSLQRMVAGRQPIVSRRGRCSNPIRSTSCGDRWSMPRRT